jgi:hypothetical protein
MQSLALTIRILFYFSGLLLKTESVEASDQEDLGMLMALLLVSVTVAVIAASI